MLRNPFGGVNGRHRTASPPTSASGLNAVEGFFAALTKRRLRRGTFLGVVDLQAAINRYLDKHNIEPRPYRWKADRDAIIAAAAMGHQALDSIHFHVRLFKLQAQKFMPSLASLLKSSALDRA